jgi:hypothetical protein
MPAADHVPDCIQARGDASVLHPPDDEVGPSAVLRREVKALITVRLG